MRSGKRNPCSLCMGPVAKNHKAVYCNSCSKWCHIKCSDVSNEEYQKLQVEDDKIPFICLKCDVLDNFDELPFAYLTEDEIFANNLTNGSQTALDNINIALAKEDKQIIKKIKDLIKNSSQNDEEKKVSCKYYNIEKFNKAKFKEDKYLSVFHLNIASLQAHIEEFKILLQLLSFEFDIIGISETKLFKDEEPIIDISLPNYSFVHTPSEASKGGTLLYISNKINYKPRPDLQIYKAKQVESTFVEIINDKSKNTIVGCIYKHHNITEKSFNEEIFEPLLKSLKNTHKETILLGDFNMNLLNMERECINKYLNDIVENNFLPLITLPTRIVSNTLIDNILYNEYSSEIKSGNLTVGISDHMPQFSLIPRKGKAYLPKYHNIYKRKFKYCDTKELENDLDSINWSYTHPQNTLDVNISIDLFMNDIETVLDKHAPLVKLTNKEHKQRQKPWITKGILKAIDTKNKILGKYLKEKVTEKKAELNKQFKLYKNKIKSLIRSSKSAHYKWFFKENSNNLKNLWKGINELVSSKVKSRLAPNLIELTDEHGQKCNITKPKEIAQSFNKYFTNVADEILKDRKYEGNRHYTNYLNNVNIESFVLKGVTELEIEKLMLGFKTNKSCGPNSIPNQLLKQMRFSLSQPIKNICNKSFQSGIFPDKLKISKVIPIHKKNSLTILSNYRPISLLSNISKILEKLMFSRLLNYLETHQMIYELQFGFRAKHSTNHALIAITQKIKTALQNNQNAIGIFVDFQKAFDTVNHDVLLEKLSKYGVQGTSQKWFKSYLSGRKQYVSLNGVDSSTLNVKHGVPQGSILGPLLFTIYINDLHKCVRNSTTFHFADDTNLLYVPRKRLNNRCIRKINNDLKCLTHWLLANKISLNVTKTELIVFRKKFSDLPECVKKIKLNGCKLYTSTEIKYLGILLDEHVTWGPQISKVNATLIRANKLLSKARYYLPQNLLLQLYYGQFYSKMSYGCQLWGENLNDSSQTSKLQRKAIRIITFSDFRAETSPIFKELKILKLTDLIEMNNVLFVHNALNQKVPDYFKNMFTRYEQHHKYNTINNIKSTYSLPAGSVVVPSGNSKRHTTIHEHCAVTWNKLLKRLSIANEEKLKSHLRNPLWLENLSIDTLKGMLKSFYISNYHSN